MKRFSFTTLIALILIITVPFFSDAQKGGNRKEIFRYKTNNKKKEEKIFRDGFMLSWNGWFEDGSHQFVRTYRQGKKHGTFTEWYRNGRKMIETTYSNDSVIGSQYNWYESGILQTEKQYNDGKVEKTINYNEKGYKKNEEKTVNNTLYKSLYEWYDSTHLKIETLLVNNKVVKIMDYYPNGNKKVEQSFDANGRLTGKYNEWYEDGKMKTEKIYKDGLSTKISEWLENGELKKSTIYLDKPKQ